MGYLAACFSFSIQRESKILTGEWLKEPVYSLKFNLRRAYYLKERFNSFFDNEAEKFETHF